MWASAINCFCLLNVSITGFIIQLVIFIENTIITISNKTNINIDVFINDCNFSFTNELSNIVNELCPLNEYE